MSENNNKSNKHSSSSIQFGNVILRKKEWKLNFICDNCKESIEDFKEFLLHSLKHVYNIDYEAIQQLMKGLVNSQRSQRTKEQDVSLQSIEDYSKANERPKTNGNIEKIVPKVFEIDPVDSTSIIMKSSRRRAKVSEEEDDDIMESLYSIEAELFKEPNNRKMGDINNKGGSVKNVAELFKENLTMKAGEDMILLDNEMDAVENSSKTKRNERNLKRKQMSSPTNTEGHMCQSCGKIFKTKPALRNHERRHFSKYYCDMCGAVFNEPVNLTVHRNRHLGIQPHQCEYCDKTFTTSTELKMHVRSHTGEKPFICQQCGAGFSTSSYLNAHIVRHSNQRSYLCDYCDKSFFSTRELDNHLRTHTNERPFKCKSCDKAFKTHHALGQHEKLHLSNKSYKCDLCDKEFAQYAGMRLHFKRFHEDDCVPTEDSILSMSDIND